MNPPYPSDEFWLLTGLAVAVVIVWIGVGLTMALYLWIDRKWRVRK